MKAESGSHAVFDSRRSNVQLPPLLVSKREAARLLNLCVRTIEKLINERQLPTKRVGKRVLLPLKDLERFAREMNDFKS
jgi:excisionase family DNA binding protein